MMAGSRGFSLAIMRAMASTSSSSGMVDMLGTFGFGVILIPMIRPTPTTPNTSHQYHRTLRNHTLLNLGDDTVDHFAVTVERGKLPRADRNVWFPRCGQKAIDASRGKGQDVKLTVGQLDITPDNFTGIVQGERVRKVRQGSASIVIDVGVEVLDNPSSGAHGIELLQQRLTSAERVTRHVHDSPGGLYQKHRVILHLVVGLKVDVHATTETRARGVDESVEGESIVKVNLPTRHNVTSNLFGDSEAVGESLSVRDKDTLGWAALTPRSIDEVTVSGLQ